VSQPTREPPKPPDSVGSGGTGCLPRGRSGAMLGKQRLQCVWRCVTDKAAPRAFIPGAATRTGLNWRQPDPRGRWSPHGKGAYQSARTIDLQQNANAAAAVTCQQGNAPAVVGDRGRSRPWHDRLRGSPSGRPAQSVPARQPWTPEAPRRSRGLGTCMVCGPHASTLSTGGRSSVQPVSRVKPAASRPRAPSRPEGPLGSGRRPVPDERGHDDGVT
jgi:hypothetical protein